MFKCRYLLLVTFFLIISNQCAWGAEATGWEAKYGQNLENVPLPWRQQFLLANGIAWADATIDEQYEFLNELAAQRQARARARESKIQAKIKEKEAEKQREQERRNRLVYKEQKEVEKKAQAQARKEQKKRQLQALREAREQRMRKLKE